MTRTLCASTALALLLAAPAATAAQEDVVVTAPTLEQWSAKMARELERNIDYPPPYHGRQYSEGVTRIRFACSETGAPAELSVLRSSGDRRLDKAALRAVGRIKTMHPLPAGITHDQRYAAVILFAASELSRDEQMRALMKEPETRRLAAGSGGRQIALVAPIPVTAR